MVEERPAAMKTCRFGRRVAVWASRPVVILPVPVQFMGELEQRWPSLDEDPYGSPRSGWAL